MKAERRLAGVIPALITPFTAQGKIDFPSLEKQVAYLATAGVDGFFINGTTGEGAYLSIAEKREVFKLVQAVSHGEQFLCLACLQPSTGMVLEEMAAFEDLRPDFVVAVTPYYYAATQEVIVKHYTTIAGQAPAPVILYTIPSCTHNPLLLETVIELAWIENIVGMKDSSGDFSQFSRGVYTDLGRDFAWIQGEDYLDGPSFLIGASGVVTGLGNVWIEPYLEMYHAALQGKTDAIHAAQKQINALYQILKVNGNQTIPLIKAAATLLGRSTPWMKLSGAATSEESQTQVRTVLKRLELL
jgi:4-hydroxy-tetrahydrodipicolinate synthase